jgi:RNA polymerase sigma-70 factor (ECF subfamily)
MRDDARAVASALSGLREGHRALFEAHRPAVERVVAAFAELDDLEARDLVLDSFARAFGRLGSLKEPARFGPWLLAAARQRCLSRLARKRDAEAIAADLGTGALIDLPPDPGPGPGALDLKALIASLPEGPEREVPRLFYVEGQFTARQIAERLELTPEVAARHLELARCRAKELLASRLLKARAQSEPGPGPEHLDAEVWPHVLHGERFAGERELSERLAKGCVTCERFLAGLHDADGLDGEVDACLVGVRQPVPGRGDSAFEQAMRRLHLHLRVIGRAGPGTGRPQPGKLGPLALAGALALLGLGVLALQGGTRRVIRRSADLPEIALSLSVPGAKGAREAVSAGASLAEDEVVFLHYELASPAFVTLLRIAPDGHPEVLAQQGRLGPGGHDLTINGQPAGVSLRGFAGQNRFFAVATITPIGPEALLAIFSAFPENGASAPALEGAGVGRVDIEVGPEGPE